MSRELLFSGQNRKEDVRRLKRLYDEVAAFAEIGGDVVRRSDTSMRVALIEAERGLGKTRLAMELYRHLTLTSDAGHYWPDTSGRDGEAAAVMPQADAFDYSRPLPFLWWGLPVSQGASVGSTLLRSLPDLLPHLVSARIAARRRASGRALLTEAADLAAEFGIPVLETALDIVGIGIFKRLAETAFKVGNILKQHSKGEPDAVANATEKLDTLTEAALSDLSLLFSPQSRIFAGVPLVVFIDDAQFADDDRGIAELLERLIERARSEHWPLLLIITHWSRQMNEWRGKDGTLNRPSEVARLLSRLFQVSEDDDAETTEFLNPEVLHHFDLSEPVENLSDAVRDRFGGLSDADITAIVEKSGGNPRKLEQISARMLRKPRWFEGNDVDAALTKEGREAVMALADLPIEEVVLERFRDTPPEVRRSVVLASLFGNRFVCELVDQFAIEQFAEPARDALETGERAYRFLHSVIDRSRDDIGVFNEKLFLDAAIEYRESGIARQELQHWPDENDLFTRLDWLLEQIVCNPQIRKGLGWHDQAEALSLAAKRMRNAGEPTAGMALALLVAAEFHRGNREGAFDAALSFQNGFPDKWGPDVIRDELTEEVALWLWYKPDLLGAASIWRGLAKYYQAKTIDNPANLAVRRKLFRVLIALGYVEKGGGQEEASAAAYSSAASTFRELTTARSRAGGEELSASEDGDSRIRINVRAGITSRRIVGFLRSIGSLSGDLTALPREGSLAPGSYIVASGSDRRTVIDEMQQRQATIVAEEWQERPDHCRVNSQAEALIYASILETECPISSDRPLEMAKLLNRLDREMPLDYHTVFVYGFSKGLGKPDRPIRRADLRMDSPYNSYKNRGLPPTPISNPSRESIRAALNPEGTNALFSLSYGAGGSVFADTLSDHSFNLGVLKSWHGRADRV